MKYKIITVHVTEQIWKGNAYEGAWHDGKSRHFWGQINGTRLIWRDGVQSKIIVDSATVFRLPLSNETLTGVVIGQDMIKWNDGSIWVSGMTFKHYLHHFFTELGRVADFSVLHNFDFYIHLPANHKIKQPFCYEKHMNFLNTADFNTTNPIYINIVRHPIDRIVSWYYYARSLSYIVGVSGKLHHNFSETEIIPRLLPDMKMMKTTFEKCATDNDRVCTYPIGMRNHFKSIFHVQYLYIPYKKNTL